MDQVAVTVRHSGLMLALTLVLLSTQALAVVRMTFWSRDTGSHFPHAFFTLKGKLDATGEVIDTSYGFTLNALSLRALFSSVPGHMEISSKEYMQRSDAQFSVAISDAQYAAIAVQVEEWSRPASRWNLNRRNCVHFVAEAARRAGLVVVEEGRLMKKPKSFVRSLIPLNVGRITVIGLSGKDYWAKEPDQEIFGVPADNKGSVLERRIEKRTLERKAQP